MSCGIKNNVATTTTIEVIDGDDEVQVVGDVDMTQPKDPAREQQDMKDEEKTKEVKKRFAIKDHK